MSTPEEQFKISLAKQYRLQYKICRKCGARNPIRATQCRKCRSYNLRLKHTERVGMK